MGSIHNHVQEDLLELTLVAVRFRQLLFQVEFDLMPGVLHQARFQEVSLQPDRDTNSFPVTLVLDDPENITLRPGMSVSVRLYHASFQVGRWALPEEALFDRSGTSAHVWRINPEEQRVHKTAITLDESGYLLKGLAPGDRIVAAGVAGLTEGQIVQPWVREGGFEPPTSTLSRWHSTTELLPLTFIERRLEAAV